LKENEKMNIHEKNLLRDLKFDWSENNFVGILKIMNNAAKNIDNLAINLSVLHNYFGSLTKLLF